MSVSRFIQTLETYRELTDCFLSEARERLPVGPEHLAQGVFSYLLRPAKRLRPALLLMSCEAVGGELHRAVPAAAAVELFHTWTLVHDDIIDNDSSRRGGPTVHVEAAAQGQAAFGLDRAAAARYGRDVAILAGDIQQGWATGMLLQCVDRGVSERLILALVRELTCNLNPRLIQGEMLDVQYACRTAESVCEDDLLTMLRLKTGALLRYAATAGAAIGRNCLPGEDPLVDRLGEFAEGCGIAFQLQDDILGISGDEQVLGKPVGSDILEGKLTVPVLHLLATGSVASRRLVSETLGDRAADRDRIDRVRACLIDEGAVAYTRDLAERLLREAMAVLDETLPPSERRGLLRGWAEFMLERSF